MFRVLGVALTRRLAEEVDDAVQLGRLAVELDRFHLELGCLGVCLALGFVDLVADPVVDGCDLGLQPGDLSLHLEDHPVDNVAGARENIARRIVQSMSAADLGLALGPGLVKSDEVDAGGLQEVLEILDGVLRRHPTARFPPREKLAQLLESVLRLEKVRQGCDLHWRLPSVLCAP